MKVVRSAIGKLVRKTPLLWYFPNRVSRMETLQLVINWLSARRYLEIGVAHGDCFSSIKVKEKIGVDPREPAEFGQKDTQRAWRQLFRRGERQILRGSRTEGSGWRHRRSLCRRLAHLRAVPSRYRELSSVSQSARRSAGARLSSEVGGGGAACLLLRAGMRDHWLGLPWTLDGRCLEGHRAAEIRTKGPERGGVEHRPRN